MLSLTFSDVTSNSSRPFNAEWFNILKKLLNPCQSHFWATIGNKKWVKKPPSKNQFMPHIKSKHYFHVMKQYNDKFNRFHVKSSKHKPVANVQNYTGSDISSQFPRSSTLVNRIKPSQAINTTYHPKKARQGAWNATNAAVSVKRKNANTAGSKYNWTLIFALYWRDSSHPCQTNLSFRLSNICE